MEHALVAIIPQERNRDFAGDVPTCECVTLYIPYETARPLRLPTYSKLPFHIPNVRKLRFVVLSVLPP